MPPPPAAKSFAALSPAGAAPRPPPATGPSSPSSARRLATPLPAATGPAAPPATGRAAPPRPMNIIDSRFEKGRCARAIRCDECRHWCRGNAVGTFWHTRGMPAAEFRRADWERGDWDASWYCIECCADYWDCSQPQVLEYLSFCKRPSKKDQFMSARAASASTGPANPPKPRKPASIADTRFDKKRKLRQVLCGQCGELKSGDEAGAYFHRQNMPPAGERKAAWERGDWDATWYCIECYMLFYNCSYGAVCDRLGFTDRSVKKKARTRRDT